MSRFRGPIQTLSRVSPARDDPGLGQDLEVSTVVGEHHAGALGGRGVGPLWKGFLFLWRLALLSGQPVLWRRYLS